MKEKTKFGKEKYNNLEKNRKIVTYKRSLSLTKLIFRVVSNLIFHEKKREREVIE